MPIIPVDYAQANFVLKLTGDNEEMICTMGIALESGGVGDPQPIAESLHDAFSDQFMFWVNASYSCVRCDLYTNLGTGTLINSSTAAARPGLQGGAPVPQNTAYLLRKRTGRAGRAGSGRMYLPGVEESAVDATGNVTAQRITDFNTAGTNFITQVQGITGVDGPALLHSLIGDLPNAVTAIQCDSKVATQRRRLR